MQFMNRNYQTKYDTFNKDRKLDNRGKLDGTMTNIRKDDRGRQGSMEPRTKYKVPKTENKFLINKRLDNQKNHSSEKINKSLDIYKDNNNYNINNFKLDPYKRPTDNKKKIYTNRKIKIPNKPPFNTLNFKPKKDTNMNSYLNQKTTPNRNITKNNKKNINVNNNNFKQRIINKATIDNDLQEYPKPKVKTYKSEKENLEDNMSSAEKDNYNKTEIDNDTEEIKNPDEYNIDIFQMKYEELVNKNKQLQEENESMKNQINDIKNENEELKNQINDKGKETDRSEEKGKKYLKLKEKNTTLKKTLKEKMEECDKYEEDIKNYEEKIEDLEKTIEENNKKNEELEKTITEVNNKNKKLKKALKKIKKKKINKEENNEDNEENEEKEDNEEHEDNEESDNNEDNEVSDSNDKDNNEKEKEELKEKINELEKQLEEKENKLKEDNQYEKYIDENTNLIKENNDLNEKNKELENEINELKSKNTQYPNNINPIKLYYTPTLLGLTNNGSIDLKNAVLQCLSNTESLTNYFLKEKNKDRIINNNIALTNKDENQLSPTYLELIQKLWDKNESNSVDPDSFMNILNEMNPLFKTGEAEDSKDFIIYILDQLHKELKISNQSNDINPIVNEPLNNYDRYNAIHHFFAEFQNEISIISDLFYGFNEITNECLNCKNIYNSQGMQNPICYIYQKFNCLIFPLEEVKNMKNNTNNQNDNNRVSIYDCLYYNSKTYLLNKENQNACYVCQQMSDSYYTSKIYICPNVLILILNRGKENICDVKLDFTEIIEITDYVLQKDKPQVIYTLYGVITHDNQSDNNAHFVASCKSPIDNQWYRYNDAIVSPITDLQKDVIDYGTPYILFYQKFK